ncbi:MAG: hypothetical protein ACI867_000351 [Glaciecola sp.]|jgi:hypothetical protein
MTEIDTMNNRTRPRSRSPFVGFALTLTLLLFGFGGGDTVLLAQSAAGPQRAPEPELLPVPRAECGPGARPETGIQGRVSRADHESGLAAQGLQCNVELVGQHTQEKGADGTIVGSVAGYKVHRYIDEQGNECAFYDTSLLPPANAGDGNLGVRVLDMSDPENPELSMVLTTGAMVSPHESLIVSETRGLLIAVAGNLSQAVLPGIVDIYDLNGPLGCLVPVLVSMTPLGILGHESGLSPDGNTFYATSYSTGTVTALDISNPALPVFLGIIEAEAHGMSVSADGTRGYIAIDSNAGNYGFMIVDLTEYQNREPSPEAPVISFIDWTGISIPQSTIPLTIDGHQYVLESDEFGPGASRLIDISDEENPFVASNIRLEVHQQDIRDANPSIEDDPGVNTPFQFAQDYTGHYCNVPTRTDPKIVACGMSVSGLRIFNIEDPCEPYEVAYFTAPVQTKVFPEGSNWAYSMPTFASERQEIWYSESYTGFYAVKLTNDTWPDDIGEPNDEPHVPCDLRTADAGDGPVAAPNASPSDVSDDGRELPVTGEGQALLAVVALSLGAALIRRRVVTR